MTMSDYELMHNEYGDALGCDCCDYNAPLKEFKDVHTEFGTQTFHFCEICSSTHLSKTLEYPRQYGDNRHLFGAIGWIGNKILDEIRQLQRQPNELPS